MQNSYNKKYGALHNKIYMLLLELDFSPNSIGFRYWITAIIINTKCYYKNIRITDLYNEIAAIHHTTWTRVERAMRHARVNATNNIMEHFNDIKIKKISNSTVLEILTHEFLFDNHIPRID